MRFTEKAIRDLKPQVTRFEVFEDNGKGFGIRVYPSGQKSWITRYRWSDGSRRKALHGHYIKPVRDGGKTDAPGMSLEEARGKHAAIREQIRQGIDPREADDLKAEQARIEHEQELAALREAQAADTIKDLASRYIERWAKENHPVFWREEERMLDKDVIPAWGDRKAKDITRRDVLALMDDIKDRGAPVAANRTLGVLIKLFDYALDRDIVDASPIVRICRYKETSRERILTEDEIRTVWEKLDSAKTHKSIKAGLRFLLVTGQRRGELVGASWDEFDLDGRWWTIPGSRTKNSTTHRVPLSPMAMDLIKELQTLAGKSPWVIPSTRGDGKAHMTERAISRAVSNNREHFKVDPWTVHDLRRTAISMMRSIKSVREFVPKVVNHAEGGVTNQVYDRYAYDQEKRRTLEAWSRKLKKILEPKKEEDKVVQFPGKDASA